LRRRHVSRYARAVANPSFPVFDADPAVAGTNGADFEVLAYGQLILYPEVVAFGAGVGQINWRVEVSADKAAWHPIQIMNVGLAVDVDPVGYEVGYTAAAGAAKKPALIVPLVSSFFRIHASRDAGAAGSSLVIRAELSIATVDAPGG
jgi:hypothetical protein